MYETEVACKMHEKTCEGRCETGNRREGVKCGEWISKSNFGRHVRGCGARGGSDGGAVEREGSRGGRVRVRVAECPRCGRTLVHSNMARHQELQAAV